MWNFELQGARCGTTTLVDEREMPCTVLGHDGGFAERSVSAIIGDAEGAACNSKGVVPEYLRSSAGVDGMLRAGLLVPLGAREFAPADLGFPDVLDVDDWEEDDDMVDDEEDDEEEEEDDDFFPDGADEFDDDDDDDLDEGDQDD